MQCTNDDSAILQWHKNYPELVNVVYSNRESKIFFEDDHEPRRISNLMVAATGPTEEGIQRSFGSIGGGLVHVLKVKKESDQNFWKCLQYWNCPNMLQCLFLIEDLLERYL